MTHSHDRTLLARLGFQDPDLKEPIHDLACEYIALEENALTLQELVAPMDMEKLNNSVNKSTSSGYFTRSVTETKVKITSSNVEVAISKGADQYKTTIGFLDASINWTSKVRAVGSFIEIKDEAVPTYWIDKDSRKKIPEIDVPKYPWNLSTHEITSEIIEMWNKFQKTHFQVTGEWAKVTSDPIQVNDWLDGPEGRIAIEVKIHQISVGELVRQMNLYREHIYSSHDHRRIDLVVCVAFDVDGYYRDALTRERITLIKLGDKFHAWGAARFRADKIKLTEL